MTWDPRRRRKGTPGSSETWAGSSFPSSQVSVSLAMGSAIISQMPLRSISTLKASLVQVQGHAQSLRDHPPSEPVSLLAQRGWPSPPTLPARSGTTSACTVDRIVNSFGKTFTKGLGKRLLAHTRQLWRLWGWLPPLTTSAQQQGCTSCHCQGKQSHSRSKNLLASRRQALTGTSVVTGWGTGLA